MAACDVASRRWRWLMALVLMTALAVVLPPSTAEAHAQLLSSTPANGSIVDKAPPIVELVFNEEINPAFVQVIIQDNAGTSIQRGQPRVNGTKVTVDVPANVPPGNVSVLFRVTSKDAHPITGKIAFTIDGPAGFAAPSTTSTAAAGSDGGSQAAAAGTSSSGSSDGVASSTWLYLGTGLLALTLMGIGAVVLRRERALA